MIATTLYNLVPIAQTASGNSGDLPANLYLELAVDCNITAISGTTPTLQFFLDRKGADGIYYPVWQSTTFTATGQVSTSVGAGLSIAQAFGSTVRFRWVIGGTGPSWTFSVSIIAK